MLLKLFKSNSTILIVLIPLLAVVLWFFSWGNVEVSAVYNNMPLGYSVDKFYSNYYYLGKISGLMLTLLLALILTKFSSKFILIEERNYLIAFFIVFFTSCFYMLNQSLAILVAALFLVLAYYRFFPLYKKTNATLNLFETSLLISISSIFYFEFIYLIVIVWIGMFILRQSTVKDLIVTIIGLFVPYFFMTSYYYIFDDILVLKNILIPHIQFSLLLVENKLILLPYSIVFFIILLSLFKFLKNSTRKKVVVRKYYLILYLSFLISFCITIFTPARTDFILLLILTGSITNAEFFLSLRSRIYGEILFAILILAGVYITMII